MSTIRIAKNKDNPYVMVRTQTVQDAGLSWKATGILAYLLSLPDDWVIHVSEVAQHKTDGERALRSGINELIEAGYIVRETIREGNRIKEWQYIVSEQRLGTSGIIKTEKPLLCGIVQIENVQVQNGALLNTNKTEYPVNQILNNDNASVATLGSMPTQVIKEYYKKYHEFTGKEHPVLKKEQYENVAIAIYNFIQDTGADDLGAWEEIIEGHFTRTDNLQTDFNINHFATDGIMRNLMYKYAY